MLGKEEEKLVKRKLWQRNYRVKDVSNYSTFDLLVNNKVRVEVKSTSIFKRKNYWSLGLDFTKFDVLAIVLHLQFTDEVYFLKDPLFAAHLHPIAMNRLNKPVNGRNTDVIVITREAIDRFFTKNPNDVINYSLKAKQNATTK
jgi:hypothetical protein